MVVVSGDAIMVATYHGRRTGIVYGGVTTPWAWASLPGCPESVDGREFRRFEKRAAGPTVWRSWLRSRRVHGGRAGLLQHALDELGRTLDRAGIVKVTAP